MFCHLSLMILVPYQPESTAQFYQIVLCLIVIKIAFIIILAITVHLKTIET